jgi:sulfate/thiosulfate transport system ATP-binding protein
MSISLEQVSKHYDGQAAVSDVSADIDDGELFVMLGPSGSGKSTLLRAIAGLTPIDHGRIVLHGREVTNLNPREREVGFVFQNYALFRHMSVGDNIEFALRARRVRAAARKRRRAELLRLVSLEGFDDRMPSELSGGQQQRVAVARSLAHEPRVLLLDEPFGALDAKIRDELRRGIREIQRAVGITTILVTHDQEEAFTMADRIGVMDGGRLQEVGEPRELYSRPRTRFVATFLGAANLLLGRREYVGVRIGTSTFDVDQLSLPQREGAEATVVIRPEDILITTRGGRLPVQALGSATVAGLEYSGALERVRLLVSADGTLASAVSPGQAEFRIEASRDAHETETAPLSVGQQVRIGAKRIHVLPTLVSSLRLTGGPDADSESLADSPIVANLAQRMRLIPTRHDGDEPVLTGLPIVGYSPDSDLSAAVGILGQGAYQVLAVDIAARPIQRILVYAQASRPARDGALSATSSLVRHLACRAAVLVPAAHRSRNGLSYRELLDLRSSALRLHGVDLQTETFHGDLSAALRSRFESSESTLLLVGLTSLAAGAALVEELTTLCKERRPAAILLVCLRTDNDIAIAPDVQTPIAAQRAAAHGI